MGILSDVISERSRRSILASLALSFIAVLLALSLAEVGIRLFVSLRSVGPPVSAYDPVYGVRLKRNLDAIQITPEFRMHFTTNSLGFRGPEPVGPLRETLIYLGDSFTVGYGVDNGKEFPALVSDRLRATRFDGAPWINAGRGNTGQGHWIKFLQREAASFEPRAIILEVMENDFADNVRESLFGIDSTETLIELEVPGPGIGRLVEPVLDHLPFIADSHSLALVRQAYNTIASLGRVDATVDQAARDHETRLLVLMLNEVVRICHARGWPVVAIRVALEPVRDSIVARVLESSGIRSAKIPSGREMPELYYPVDGHWTERGHQFTADVVASLLLADSVLSVEVPRNSLR